MSIPHKNYHKDQPNTWTLAKTRKALTNKEITLEEIYKAVDKAIAQTKNLNIYLARDNQALTKTHQRTNLPLAGLPIAVKDNFCTKGLITTASSNVLKKFIPPFESTVTTKLQQAGGVITGKTNLDAWAHGSSTETSDFGRTLNPRNLDYLPGGSSGGSAAAVAADTCLAAIGSETAGSIRQPAAWCGVVGLKPTYGRCSRFGVVAMASSTDSPGPIAKTVEDACIVFEQIAGFDPYDSTTANKSVPKLTEELNKGIKNLKIGLLYSDIKELQSSYKLIEKELAVFERLGAKIEPVKALDPHYAIGVYTIVQRAEVSSNLARYAGVRYDLGRTQFGAEAKRRIMLGTFTLAKGYADKYYLTAQKVRTLFKKDFDQLFAKYDLLVSLTSPGFAKKVGATEGQAMFGELEDMLLEPSSITGLPGLNVPCYRNPQTNLYLGLNIIAPMWREDLMIRAGHAFEQATDWNSWRNDQ